MTLKCSIIDDEPLAANMLASYAEKTPGLTLVGTYNSAVAAIKDLREQPVDLLFLDIQMPELSGLEFARILPKTTKVVLTTAYKQYATEGYKVDALDYLLKPIAYEDFIAAVHRAVEYFENKQRDKVFWQDQYIYVKTDYKLVQVFLKDILYIEGFKDYVKIFLENPKRTIVSLINMKKIDELLPHPEFKRVHRSFIVHMPKIKIIDRARIVFEDEFIPISESYKEDVQKFIDEHTLA